jgi:PKHD-type hydroxylase
LIRLFAKLLPVDDLRAIRSEVARLPFEDGQPSAGPWGAGLKHNAQLSKEHGRQLAPMVLRLLEGPALRQVLIPTSATQPTFNRYEKGGRYGRHVDAAVQGGIRADISYTLFLSDPDEYDGGELCVHQDGQQKAYKESAGSLLAYTSGAAHEVKEVTRGVRYAAVGWIQSGVADDRQRELLFAFQDALERLNSESAPEPRDVAALREVYSNLVRLWFR